jgi:hypothetical protein
MQAGQEFIVEEWCPSPSLTKLSPAIQGEGPVNMSEGRSMLGCPERLRLVARGTGAVCASAAMQPTLHMSRRQKVRRRMRKTMMMVKKRRICLHSRLCQQCQIGLRLGLLKHTYVVINSALQAQTRRREVKM